jgi:hypothetical protein
MSISISGNNCKKGIMRGGERQVVISPLLAGVDGGVHNFRKLKKVAAACVILPNSTYKQKVWSWRGEQ